MHARPRHKEKGMGGDTEDLRRGWHYADRQTKTQIICAFSTRKYLDEPLLFLLDVYHQIFRESLAPIVVDDAFGRFTPYSTSQEETRR